MTDYDAELEDVRRRLPGDQMLWAQDAGMRAARVFHEVPTGTTPGVAIIIADSIRQLVSDEEWKAHLKKFVEGSGPGVIAAAVVFGVTVGLIASDPRAVGMAAHKEKKQGETKGDPWWKYRYE